jgi:hypothetical protein
MIRCDGRDTLGREILQTSRKDDVKYGITERSDCICSKAALKGAGGIIVVSRPELL